ncbi:hypothetical protein Tco_1525369 [Tanacetum coccineum]
MKQGKKTKPSNYEKINKLSKVFVSKKSKSKEEVYFSNTSKTVSVSNTVSKLILIPDDEFLDDTLKKSVAQKFLNESNTFEKEFLKEATNFVRDYKSLAKEADESLEKIKVSEQENERLLRAVVSQDIMSIMQNHSVLDTSNIQTEFERTKEKLESCIIKMENEYASIWNKWYKKCEECKYDKFLYDKAYSDMQQQIERLQAQLGDLKGKSSKESLASPMPRKPRTLFWWLPTGIIFDLSGKLLDTSNTKAENEISACDYESTSNSQEPTSKRFPNTFLFLAGYRNIVLCVDSGCSKHMTGNLKLLIINCDWKCVGTVRFGNDHVAAILGYSDLQWGIS